MPFLEFDVVQPPNAGELEAELRALPQLGSAALRLVVVLIPDELTRRRNTGAEVPYEFEIESTSQGGTPFIIGHLADAPYVTGRLEVVTDRTDVEDSERPLRLTLFDPEY